ncbi:IS1380 family transposase [Solwaraspora sp. WMMA2080]|uniref:IS1380 family transposase n=1 Tax=unclassified Solwaraspora TaxID=2627926 RepID=UPI00248AA169|nr:MULTISPECIES: IS1380 family transposase [unclassified Solwaraspora]WBB94896.1 IS1380 family transposase [Solwaraspora sp. WMMA2059]WBB97271.1 IS1380 family transposase [Solwaraspora sp. WMMA2059]WBB99254.1 IS1380 family transposase [Solwaraspora sp. WMMA2059]WBC20016.1 IS1380 family transposase [Solwaraspora sp. WMMA2080]WBC21220.1 IS1380 family transposase [Solwaraspora sp. WMMA2080]
MRELTGWSKDLRVTADGDGVVAMVGVAGLRMLADRTGLTAGISTVLARPGFDPVHDRGRVLTDIACSIAAGGTDVYDIEALRAQAALFGPVASDTTALRALGEISDSGLHRIDAARAKSRAHLWSLLPAGVPEATYAGGLSMGGTIVLRVDGTITVAHSRKEHAEATFKKTFGFHSLGVWIDNTGELAALMPRPGNAGANTAADLIEVLRQAIAQIPADRRDDLLITSDGAGASHTLIDWLHSLDQTGGRRVAYSIGFDVDEHVRAACNRRPDDWWVPCLSNTTGEVIDGLQVTEITDLLRERLTGLKWPKTMRVIVRRRKLFDHEQATLFDTCGYRYSAFVTNTGAHGPDGLSVQRADARHRVHARVEDDVRTTKDTGLGHLPSKQWQVNKAWCAAVTIAVDLTAWMRLYALTGALAKAEPKTLRYRIFQTPARLVRARRYRWLRLPHTWPWATDLATAIEIIRRMPMPAT